MKYFASITAIFAAVFFVIKPKVISAAVSTALSDCLEVIVPSLFAFTVLSIFLQKSGLYKIALKPLTFPLSKLLKTDEELCAIFILANIGGYPVGVKLLGELVKSGRISREDAGRMLCCCFGSGPSFIISIAGIHVFGSTAAGLALLGACLASSLLMAAIVRLKGKIVLKEPQYKLRINSDCFISSVTDGAKVLFTVCAMITAFAVISAMLREIGVFSLFERFFSNSEVFPALLEVTRIKNIKQSAYALPLCAALLSFGGVCVLLQITALSKGISLKRFLISRVPAALFSALAALPLQRFIKPADIQTIAQNVAAEPFTKNAILSICVLAMCVILLLNTKFHSVKKL